MKLLTPKIAQIINSQSPLTYIEKSNLLADFKLDDSITLYGGRLLHSKHFKKTLSPHITKSKTALILYAGVGAMGLMAQNLKNDLDLTCVEKDANLIAIGKKLLPEAKWIQADPYTFRSEDNSKFDLVLTLPTEEFRSNGFSYEKVLMEKLKGITKNIIHFIPNTGLMLLIKNTTREYLPFTIPEPFKV